MKVSFIVIFVLENFFVIVHLKNSHPSVSAAIIDIMLQDFTSLERKADVIAYGTDSNFIAGLISEISYGQKVPFALKL